MFCNRDYTVRLHTVLAACIHIIKSNPVRAHKELKRIGTDVWAISTGNTFGYLVLSSGLRLF